MKRVRNASLAALAALLIAAFANVGSASATGFTAETPSTTFVGSASGLFDVYDQSGEFECSSFTMEGTVEGATETAGWAMMGCAPFTVKSNGCNFRFHPGEETSAGHFKGSLQVDTAGCSGITYTYKTCTRTIPPQSGIPVSYTNTGAGASRAVKVEMNHAAYKYTTKAGGCAETGTFTGQMSGTLVLEGREGGIQKGIQVSASAHDSGEPNGLFMETGAGKPWFNAEYLPAYIHASQDGTQVLYTEVGEVECSVAEFEGSASAATSEFTTAPTFSGCTLAGQNSTVNVNGCQYVFHATSAGPPYAGEMELTCPSGSKLIVHRGTCSVSFPAQSLARVTYVNYGEGSNRYVIANVSNGGGVEYTTSNCGTAGTHHDGELEGSTKLAAVQ